MPLLGILDGFETPSKANFSYFLSQETKGKNNFSAKFREKSEISGKNRIFREKSAIFSRFFFFIFFPVQIFSKPPENRFFGDKSTEKSDFLFPGPEPITP